jgi:hypothetical protein
VKDESDILREIGEHEAWLRQAIPPVTPPSMEPLKLRLRVAGHEAWLARAAADGSGSAERSDPSPDLFKIKSAVRIELARARLSRTKITRRRWMQWGGVLATAAVVLFAVLVVRQGMPHRRDAGQLAGDRLGEFAEALSVVVPEAEESASEWDDLAADIGSLEDALAAGNQTAWGAEELDDLDRDLESLVEQIGQGS